MSDFPPPPGRDPLPPPRPPEGTGPEPRQPPSSTEPSAGGAFAAPSEQGPRGFAPPGFGPPQAPATPGDPTAPFAPLPTVDAAPGSPQPSKKKLWIVAGVAAIVAIAIVSWIVATNGDGDKTVVAPVETASDPAPETSDVGAAVQPDTSPDSSQSSETDSANNGSDTGGSDTTDASEPASSDRSETTDATSSPPPQSTIVTGQAITLDDGTIVRLDSVTPNAPPSDDFFQPDPGTSLTRLEIEGCGGRDGFATSSLNWLGFLEDNTSVDAFLFGGDLESVTVADGACIRGSVDLQVPDGHNVVSVVMRDSLFQEAARWDTTTATPVDAPLQSPKPVSTFGVGEKATFPDGSTAVLKSVTPNAPPLNEFSPPDPGRQLVRIEVEQCAGSTPLSVSGVYWYAAAVDNRTGSSTFAGDTLPTIDLAAGQCAAGLVEIDLPADATVGTVFLTDVTLKEIARWRAT